MNAIAYEPLSAQDRTFLPYETATSPMHITWTLVFDSPPRGAPIRLGALRRSVGSRLSSMPRLRQRLAFAPITGEPHWVEDEGFDLSRHVRAVRLAAPGDDEALKATTAWLIEQPLSRSRPLWEAWLVEGLARRRAAVVVKLHHAMADGISTVDVLTALFAEVASREGSSSDERPPTTSRSPGVVDRVRATLATMADGITPSPVTSLNRPIGRGRRVEWTSFDLDDVRSIRRRVGGTLNDVVLATVAGAVRRFLAAELPILAERDFRVVVPVSVRAPEERGRLGNRASAWLLPLPTGEADPLRRLARVREQTARFKESGRALGGEMLNELAGTFGSAMTTLGIRVLTEMIRPYNLIVTNIPGTDVPLVLGGAPLVAAYPQVPLFPNQALGIALSSDRRRLFWGFSSDRDLNLAAFCDAVCEAFLELGRATEAAQVA